MAVAAHITRSFSRTTSEPREFLTEAEQKKCKSVAEAIRLCKKKHPDASNGEIARYLQIRPQWVFNVINNPPKGK